MSFAVWIQFADAAGARDAAGPLRHALSAAGIGLGIPPQGVLHAACPAAAATASGMADRPPSAGVFLFDDWSPATAEALRGATNAAAAYATSPPGAARCVPILAICCAASPLATDAMWSVLACGAADLLHWPCAEQAVARLQRWHEVEQLMSSPAVQDHLIGESPIWRALLRAVVEVAAFTQSPVLVTGETGTGKDLIAQALHRLSGAGGALTVLDCTTIAPDLAGSELFGHERGAFTGAYAARDGAFAEADGGVLFLDEVGELPIALQAQLLRVIQEQQYRRIGSNHWQPTRFRLVCATNRDLEAEVARGTFRADLYYRIAGWRCRTPPLRERPGDILPLVSHFLRQLSGHDFALDPAIRQYLLTRPYPGNVRDLRQTVARIWHRHTGPAPITIGDVPPDERRPGTPSWPDARFDDAIRHALDLGISLSRIGQTACDTAIRLALEQEGDNNQRAALRLGVTDRALQLRRKARAA